MRFNSITILATSFNTVKAKPWLSCLTPWEALDVDPGMLECRHAGVQALDAPFWRFIRAV